MIGIDEWDCEEAMRVLPAGRDWNRWKWQTVVAKDHWIKGVFIRI